MPVLRLGLLMGTRIDFEWVLRCSFEIDTGTRTVVYHFSDNSSWDSATDLLWTNWLLSLNDCQLWNHCDSLCKTIPDASLHTHRHVQYSKETNGSTKRLHLCSATNHILRLQRQYATQSRRTAYATAQARDRGLWHRLLRVTDPGEQKT